MMLTVLAAWANKSPVFSNELFADSYDIWASLVLGDMMVFLLDVIETTKHRVPRLKQDTSIKFIGSAPSFVRASLRAKGTVSQPCKPADWQ